MIDMTGYDSGFSTISTPSIYQITCQAVPEGRPFIYMFRGDVPFDYEENPDFTPDWEHPDGYGGCSV